MREKILAHKKRFPRLSKQAIANYFNVDLSIVKEALKKKKQKIEKVSGVVYRLYWDDQPHYFFGHTIQAPIDSIQTELAYNSDLRNAWNLSKNHRVEIVETYPSEDVARRISEVLVVQHQTDPLLLNKPILKETF